LFPTLPNPCAINDDEMQESVYMTRGTGYFVVSDLLDFWTPKIKTCKSTGGAHFPSGNCNALLSSIPPVCVSSPAFLI
jgi:hypothetical protein